MDSQRPLFQDHHPLLGPGEGHVQEVQPVPPSPPSENPYDPREFPTVDVDSAAAIRVRRAALRRGAGS